MITAIYSTARALTYLTCMLLCAVLPTAIYGQLPTDQPSEEWLSFQLETSQGIMDIEFQGGQTEDRMQMIFRGTLGDITFHYTTETWDQDKQGRALIRHNDRETQLRWWKEREPHMGGLTVQHNDQPAVEYQVDLRRVRQAGQLVDSDGTAIDLQGDLPAMNIQVQEIATLLKEDPKWKNQADPSSASAGFRVTGKCLIGNTNVVVPGARVKLISCNSRIPIVWTACAQNNVRQTTADAQGFFAFEHVNGSELQLLAEYTVPPNLLSQAGFSTLVVPASGKLKIQGYANISQAGSDISKYIIMAEEGLVNYPALLQESEEASGWCLAFLLVPVWGALGLLWATK